MLEQGFLTCGLLIVSKIFLGGTPKVVVSGLDSFDATWLAK